MNKDFSIMKYLFRWCERVIWVGTRWRIFKCFMGASLYLQRLTFCWHEKYISWAYIIWFRISAPFQTRPPIVFDVLIHRTTFRGRKIRKFYCFNPAKKKIFHRIANPKCLWLSNEISTPKNPGLKRAKNTRLQISDIKEKLFHSLAEK